MATQPLPRSPRRARLRVVEGEGRGSTKSGRRSPIPVVLLVVLMVFGVAALQAWVGQDGLRAASLERELQKEQERLTLLRAHVAQLTSPNRLREEATKLGLVPDPSPVYLQAPVAITGWMDDARHATKRLTAAKR